MGFEPSQDPFDVRDRFRLVGTYPRSFTAQGKGADLDASLDEVRVQRVRQRSTACDDADHRVRGKRLSHLPERPDPARGSADPHVP